MKRPVLGHARRRCLRVASVVVGVMAGALPASPAAASAEATARGLDAGVPPGLHTYTLQLTNVEPSGTGKTIDFFIVELPRDAGIAIAEGTPRAGNFTARKVTLGDSTDAVVFENGTLVPGGSITVEIPARAGAPSGCDRAGTWRVRVSSDNGATLRSAREARPGALQTIVHAIEIMSMKPVAPFDPATQRGVRDGTGTAGQLITYQYVIRNHSTTAHSLTTFVGSSSTDDVPAGAVTTTVEETGSETRHVAVQLGSATAERTVSFTAHAAGECATARPRADVFTVQVPVQLSFTGPTPRHVRSGRNSATAFTVAVVKTGGPAFDLRAGRLGFGANTAMLQSPMVIPAGNRTVHLAFAVPRVEGAEGGYPASVSSTGEDFNAVALAVDRSVGAVQIDNTGPIVRITDVSLPRDRDGDRQTAAKRHDTVVVRGGVLADDPTDAPPRVCLIPDSGPGPCVAASTARGDGTPVWTAIFGGSATDWHLDATMFGVSASVTDIAGNEGVAYERGPFLVDRAAPALGDPARGLQGVVLDEQTISVAFTDDVPLNVRGGCDVLSWLVDGVPRAVAAVRLSDGSVCSGASGDADVARRRTSDGIRLLTLARPLVGGARATPTVSYEPLPRPLFYPAKDGAGNDVPSTTFMATSSSRSPARPVVDAVERRDGASNAPYETAYFDVSTRRYYTNVGGPDGVRVRWSFTVPLLRGTSADGAGYAVRVSDGSGATLGEVPAGEQDAVSGRFSGTVAVPLPAADGTFARRLRVVVPSGATSAPVDLRVVVDTERPAVETRTVAAFDTVVLTFSEKVVAGTNFAADWTIGFEMRGDEGPIIAFRPADAVVHVDHVTRRLAAGLTRPTAYRSSDYVKVSSAGARYEDRAGNPMPDTRG